MNQVFDVAIIGGGINGCGCAADAASRGLSTILFDKDDLASKTSSSSTKLIHGGLRYLEHYEFSLVKKALTERQNLLNLAPHLVEPQAFVLPQQKHMRSPWLLRMGLFIYDHLNRKNKLPNSKYLFRRRDKQLFLPLMEQFKSGFLFYDAATDDARLTLANALQAKRLGASIRPHAKVIGTKAVDNLWELTIEPKDGAPYTILAKALINATGPWVNSIASLTQIPVQQKIALVKGSHIVVPKMYEGSHAYFLQHKDNRVIFVIPYEGYSMIGTTEVHFTGSPDQVQISDEEIHYLTSAVNQYFKFKLTKDEVIYSWSGVRPLLADEDKSMNALSRDYIYSYSSLPSPIVTIYGGKITTYRQLSEEVIDQLGALFPNLPKSKTGESPLPGAQWDTMDFSHYADYAKKKYDWLEPDLLNRYLYSYGTLSEHFLAQCTKRDDLGQQFSPGLYQVEVDYLIREEWARDSDDILKRRTKLGLVFNKECVERLNEYLAHCYA